MVQGLEPCKRCAYHHHLRTVFASDQAVLFRPKETPASQEQGAEWSRQHEHEVDGEQDAFQDANRTCE
jgi:hypothetical protein